MWLKSGLDILPEVTHGTFTFGFICIKLDHQARVLYVIWRVYSFLERSTLIYVFPIYIIVWTLHKQKQMCTKYT